MDSKSQFLSNKELASWWGGIASDSRFDAVLLHASGVALESCPTEEQRKGVLAFKDILLTISDAESAPIQFASPGLSHDLEINRRTVQPPAKQPEKPKKK